MVFSFSSQVPLFSFWKWCIHTTSTIGHISARKHISLVAIAGVFNVNNNVFYREVLKPVLTLWIVVQRLSIYSSGHLKNMINDDLGSTCVNLRLKYQIILITFVL